LVNGSYAAGVAIYGVVCRRPFIATGLTECGQSAYLCAGRFLDSHFRKSLLKFLLLKFLLGRRVRIVYNGRMWRVAERLRAPFFWAAAYGPAAHVGRRKSAGIFAAAAALQLRMFARHG
jgi:hypothetical protein